MIDLPLFVVKLAFLIMRIKWLRKLFVAFNMCFHVSRLIIWVEVIQYKNVHLEHLKHLRERIRSQLRLLDIKIMSQSFESEAHENSGEKKNMILNFGYFSENYHKRQHKCQKQPSTVMVRREGITSHDCWTIPMWLRQKFHSPHAKNLPYFQLTFLHLSTPFLPSYSPSFFIV